MKESENVDPFHAAERALQERCGVRERARERAALSIRSSMPEQHRRFFETLPLVFVAALDVTGHPRVGVIGGAPGFIRATTSNRLLVRVAPSEAVSVASPSTVALGAAAPGAPVGLLGIDFASGRRNRANGVVERRDGDHVALLIRQSFGNCSRNIHRRRYQPREPTEVAAVKPIEPRSLIAHAATFFIASRSAEFDALRGGGMDISHRGGPSGFVRWVDDQTIAFADDVGNNFFNTLGNIAADPRVSLLFIDFDEGRGVHVAGNAEIVWSAAASPSARLVRVNVTGIDVAPAITELRWPLVAPAAACPSCATDDAAASSDPTRSA